MTDREGGFLLRNRGEGKKGKGSGGRRGGRGKEEITLATRTKVPAFSKRPKLQGPEKRPRKGRRGMMRGQRGCCREEEKDPWRVLLGRRQVK